MIYEIPKETADVVIGILKTRPITVMSWGAKGFASDTCLGMNALRFSVNGFKHKGLVYVCYNEATDLFDVFLASDNIKTNSLYTDIFFDELVDVIDSAVETDNHRGDEYKANIMNEYGLKSK